MKHTNESTRPRGADGAFTLIELLVVIGIIILLVGILVPTISGVVKSAAATKS